MEYEEIIQAIQQASGGLSREAAERAAQATLQTLAAREGAEADEADLFTQVFEQARAVFAMLAEAVSRKEWFDIVVELPEDFRPLMPAGIA